MKSIKFVKSKFIQKICMTSNKNNLCNLMVEDSDLKKLEDLDPFQTQGFQSIAKLTTQVKIIYTDEMNKITMDTQLLTFQILTRWIRNIQKHKQEPALESMRIILTSEEDIFLSFVCNCLAQTFEILKQKNEFNLHFNDFPNTLIKLLQGSGANNSGKSQVELKLTHEGTGKLYIFEETDYKRLELVELLFQSSSIQKAHQSIIYRYNYNRTKLSMLQNSIETVYKILAEKNAPLLHYIQKTVGIDE